MATTPGEWWPSFCCGMDFALTRWLNGGQGSGPGNHGQQRHLPFAGDLAAISGAAVFPPATGSKADESAPAGGKLPPNSIWMADAAGCIDSAGGPPMLAATLGNAYGETELSNA